MAHDKAVHHQLLGLQYGEKVIMSDTGICRQVDG
jgi:hypothetical protein